MNVCPSGYYAWQHQPLSSRALEDQRLLGQIKQCWLESGGFYGYRKIRDDLREMGETCGKHRVARLMLHEGLRSQTGYRRRPGHYGGRPTVVAPNHLECQFDVTEPNKVWVTDITYIRTHEGWLYLAAVLEFVLTTSHWLVNGATYRPRAGYQRVTDGGVATATGAGSAGSFRPREPV